MGCNGSSLSAEDLQNREIEKMMTQAREEDSNKLKLLLLGAGESGKSTLFKQMKILYSASHGYSDDEKERFIATIHQNIIVDMKVVVEAAESEIKNEDALAEFKSWDKRRVLKAEEKSILQSLWEDPAVTNTWNNRGKLQVQDALEYNMDNIDRMTKDGYLPTVPDILRSRVRTTGVVHETFKIDDRAFEMYDVGGQRNERRKWIHSFENVTAVMFVGAISEYNQVLFEDVRQNRQDEAITLFGSLLANEYFRNSPFILFLNKKDLFRQKLAKIPFRIAEGGDEDRNVDFEGPYCDPNKNYDTKEGADSEFEACYAAACEYLKRKYLAQQDNAPGRNKVSAQVYPHFTNSTDSKNIENIMNACKDIILRIELEGIGLLS